MKKKYVKPTITSFAVPVVRAQGFEIMGLCQSGTFVGDDDKGSCAEGYNPKSLEGTTCGSGSSDGTSGIVCDVGQYAG